MRYHLPVAALVAVILAASLPSQAGTISWTDWTSATSGAGGSASGTMLIGATNVGVSYSGDVDFAQLGTGTNYFYPATPYVSSIVPNAPTAAEMIALSRTSQVNTITFSQPVVDPVMAIVSMGRTSLPVLYAFNADFDVISVGPGYWGNGTLTELAGNVLEGREGHGVIRFNGTISSISWAVNPGEYWHGITVGAPAVAVPLPSAAWAGLSLLGAVALAKLRRR